MTTRNRRTFLITGLAMAVTFARGGEISPPRLLTFRLNETAAALSSTFKQQPTVVSQPTFRVLQFHDAAVPENHSCEGDFEWEFFFGKGGDLQSVTWNSEKPVPVNLLFPGGKRNLLTSPDKKVSILTRRLDGDRVLIANINSADQTEVRQAVLMRPSAVARFIPWAAAELNK